MSAALLEIVELPDGRIALRRAEDGELLITMDFSDEGKAFVQSQQFTVAKAMLNMSVEMAEHLADGGLLYDDEEDVMEDPVEEAPRVLH